jgi:hypothetical protein
MALAGTVAGCRAWVFISGSHERRETHVPATIRVTRWREGGPPVTNIRNTSSPHWRMWLKPENRCFGPVQQLR